MGRLAGASRLLSAGVVAYKVAFYNAGRLPRCPLPEKSCQSLLNAILEFRCVIR